MTVAALLVQLGMEAGRSHRIDRKTGSVESLGPAGWTPTGVWIDREDGEVYRRTAAGGRATGIRVDPETGRVSENFGFATGVRWDHKSGDLHDDHSIPGWSGWRVNKRSGVLEEPGLLGWTASRRVASPTQTASASLWDALFGGGGAEAAKEPPRGGGGGATGDALGALFGAAFGLGALYSLIASPWFVAHCGAAWLTDGTTPDVCAASSRAALTAWHQAMLHDGRELTLSSGLLGVPMVLIGALAWVLSGFAFYIVAGPLLIVTENMGPGPSGAVLVVAPAIFVGLALPTLRALRLRRPWRRGIGEATELVLAGLTVVSLLGLAIPGSAFFNYVGEELARALHIGGPLDGVVTTALARAEKEAGLFYGAFEHAEGTSDAFGRLVVVVATPVGTMLVNGFALMAGTATIFVVFGLPVLAFNRLRGPGQVASPERRRPELETLLAPLLAPLLVVLGATVLQTLAIHLSR